MPDRKEQCLWFNKDILIDQQTIHYKHFSNVGINYVNDLYRAEGVPKTFQFWLKKGLQKGDYLKWRGLIKATKKMHIWKDKTERAPNIVCTIRAGKTEKHINEIRTKEVYMSIIGEDKNISFDVKPQVIRYLHGTEEVNWHEIFSLIKKHTVDTKSKEFQFMFLHDILPTKYWLFKWKIEDNDRCTFCNSNTETLGHLFWDCARIKALWLEIETWIRQAVDIDVSINEKMFFLGSESALLHTLITVAKRHIFQSRCNNQQPTMNVYHAKVQSVMKTEIYIARSTTNHKLMKLLGKWEVLQSHFET